MDDIDDVSLYAIRDEIRLAPGGDVEELSSPRFQRRLFAMDPSANIVVDLSDVTDCDSSGLGALEGAAERAALAGGTFTLYSPSPTVMKQLVQGALAERVRTPRS